MKFERQAQKEAARVIPMKGYLRWVAAAAVVLLVLIPFGTYFLRNGYNVNPKEFVLTVPAGSELQVKMSDGTTILLGPGSQLSYDENYGRKERLVHLDGNGQFNVRHDGKKPFMVQSDRLTVNDLGTTFTMRNYHEDRRAIVSVSSGSVSVGYHKGESRHLVMHKGDAFALDKISGVGEKLEGSVMDDGSSFAGVVFSDEELAVIAKELERSYAIRCVIARGSEKKRFFVSFNRKTDSPEDVLKTLGQTGHLSYRMLGNHTYLLR
jgi:transmembrane sensor